MASPGSAASSYRPSIPEMVAEWVRQGTEGFIATQKILLDLAAQQNALALTIIRERVGLFPQAPVKALVDLTSKCLQNFMQAQQIALDIAARQNSILADGLKPALAGSPAERLATIVHDGLDTFIAGQKKFLEYFESEAEGALKDLGDSKGFDTNRLSDLAREGVRTFVTSQKQFLDVVEEELTAKRESASSADGEAKSVDLFDMAKKSIDSFVDAQRRFLDLTSDQINVNVQFVKDVFEPETRAQATTLPDIVKKSVESFVAAQKALVDLASKPRKPAKEAQEHESEIVLAKA
jgi:hypothetical protein